MAPDIRHKLLRHRVHGRGRGALRFRPVRVRSGPRLRSSPRQADFIMVAGTIVNRMAPVLRRLYDQLAEPKYVIACGSCAISGGPFRNSYHVAKGIEDIVPVDVYCPGCPPRPEAMIYSIMQLSRKMKVERFFGVVNRKEDRKKYLQEHPVTEE